MVARSRRFGDGDLAVFVEKLVAAGRRDEHRRIVLAAENVGAHVHLRDVIEPARAKLEFQKPLTVGAQRHLVVDAGGHVAEMRRRYVFERGRLEVEHVDRLFRAFDRLKAPRRPDHRVRKFQRCVTGVSRQSGRCDQRTCGEILQEPAAARCANDFGCHFIPPCHCSWLFKEGS